MSSKLLSLHDEHVSAFLAREDHGDDLGLKVNYEKFRAGVNGFYAWIHNYITYINDASFPIFGSRGYQFINTREAILTGGEAYMEYDLTCWLAPFATISYALAHLGSASRIFVCNGSYSDTLSITGAVSIFGGLTCTAGTWAYATGTRATVTGPASGPALSIAAQ